MICHETYSSSPLLLRPESLQWRHSEHGGMSHHQRHDCSLNRLFRRRSKKTSKLRVTGLCAENSPVTGEFPAQRASNVENVSIWWHHHGCMWTKLFFFAGGPFYWHGLTLIPTSINYHIQYKLWGWINIIVPHFTGRVIMLGLKLLHISKRGQGYPWY